jgi:CDP-diacylglycerol pyrophosphatase
MIDEDGVEVVVDNTIGTTSLREVATANHFGSTCRADPSLSNHSSDHQRQLARDPNSNERNAFKERAVTIPKVSPDDLQICANQRTNLYFHWRILPQPLRQSPSTTSRIPDRDTQNRSMAETLTAKIADAEFQDPV